MIHKDLKPENLMLTRQGALKIVDFGTAACLDQGKAETTDIEAPPSYMSPEQIAGRPLDERTDIL